MAERGGLGLLQVGVARDRGLGVTLRQVGQQGGESGEIVASPLGGISQVQTQIEGHLVVARTPGVKLLTACLRPVRRAGARLRNGRPHRCQGTRRPRRGPRRE